MREGDLKYVLVGFGDAVASNAEAALSYGRATDTI